MRLDNFFLPAQARIHESNQQDKFRCRGSRHESAVAQLCSLGSIKPPMKSASIFFLLIILLFGCLDFYFSRLPVSSSRLNELKKGMPTNEVETLLGRPLEIRYLGSEQDRANATNDMCFMWVYESYYHFWAEEVFFDHDGHYTKNWRD